MLLFSAYFMCSPRKCIRRTSLFGRFIRIQRSGAYCSRVKLKGYKVFFQSFKQFCLQAVHLSKLGKLSLYLHQCTDKHMKNKKDYVNLLACRRICVIFFFSLQEIEIKRCLTKWGTTLPHKYTRRQGRKRRRPIKSTHPIAAQAKANKNHPPHSSSSKDIKQIFTATESSVNLQNCSTPLFSYGLRQA